MGFLQAREGERGGGVQNKAGQSRLHTLSLTAHCHLFQGGKTNKQTNRQTEKTDKHRGKLTDKQKG